MSLPQLPLYLWPGMCLLTTVNCVRLHLQETRWTEVADTYKKSDVLSVEESIVNHVEYTLARSRYFFDDQEAYQAASLSLRDRLIESWNDTQQHFK